MSVAVTALAPVFGLIVLGFVFRAVRYPGPAFWAMAEKFTYFVLFPALLFRSLAVAHIDLATAGPMAAALAIGVAVTALMAVMLKPLLRLSAPAFSSLFQGAIRPNTYVAIAAALGAWGEPGVTLTVIAIGVVVPLVNVLAVGALAGLGSGGRGGATGFVRAVLANPLILACLAGAGVNVTGLALPGTLDMVFDLAGKAALLLGLMSVGAALEPQRLVHDVKPLGVTCLLKLALSPAVTALAAMALGVTGLAFKAAVLYAALPVSASAYVLAARMGGDRALMAGALTATTVLAAASLPLVLVLLGG